MIADTQAVRSIKSEVNLAFKEVTNKIMKKIVSDCKPQQVIFDTLDKLDIKCEIINHKPLYTMKDGLDIAKRLHVAPCKNLLLCNRQQQFFLVMLMGTKRLAVKKIASQIGSSHLSFSTDEQLKMLMHAQPGGVSPLGLLFDTENKVQLLVDTDILALRYVGCHPCINTCSIG